MIPVEVVPNEAGGDNHAGISPPTVPPSKANAKRSQASRQRPRKVLAGMKGKPSASRRSRRSMFPGRPKPEPTWKSC